ncbi:BON domain-containing protein [Anatilimnocola floriformis]|uniref:BON domain-containing protein n=1 Tax=Anatilimnocola floriformis TaxID=2948575 RepID=UPI0036F3B406
MQTRYSNLPALKGKGNIEPVLEGDVLVLRGSVESAADRQLAEDLLSLEPGVNQVRNELVIGQPASAPVPVSLVVPATAAPSAPKIASRPLER